MSAVPEEVRVGQVWVDPHGDRLQVISVDQASERALLRVRYPMGYLGLRRSPTSTEEIVRHWSYEGMSAALEQRLMP